MGDIGHNSGTTEEVSGAQLLSFIERVERLDEEAKALNDDRKEVYSEAKSMGFDVKILKQIVAERRVDLQTRQEQETILDLYREAIRRHQGAVSEARASRDTPAPAHEAPKPTKTQKTRPAPEGVSQPEPTAPEAVNIGGPAATPGAAEGRPSTREPVVRPQDSDAECMASDGAIISAKAPTPSPIPDVAAKAEPEMPDIPPYLDRRERLLAAAAVGDDGIEDVPL